MTEIERAVIRCLGNESEAGTWCRSYLPDPCFAPFRNRDCSTGSAVRVQTRATYWRKQVAIAFVSHEVRVLITCQPTLTRAPGLRRPYRKYTRAPADFGFARL